MSGSIFSPRLRRASFVDGLGIYVGDHQVALVQLTKRFTSIVLREARTYPLPPRERAGERHHALVDALLAFSGGSRVDNPRAYLCIPRSEVALNRVVLPGAARENLAQVLEYELDRLIPLPRDQVHYDYVARDVGADRLEVLILCVPRRVLRAYLDALGEAFIRPRGITIASTAVADYLAFCQGSTAAVEGPLGLLLGDGEAVEFALVAGERLLASQLFPRDLLRAESDLLPFLERELSDEMIAPEDLRLFRWDVGNESAPPLPDLGEGKLLALARECIAAPEEFFAGGEPVLLPALGAALAGVREGRVAMNLLPEEGRKRLDEGPSLVTLALAGAALLLSLAWGGGTLAKEAMLRRELRARLRAIAPRVEEVRRLQDEVSSLRHQIEVLTAGRTPPAVVLLRELTRAIPTDAYVQTINLRERRVTLEGFARSASDVITSLERSKYFKNVQFTSPTTRVRDRERFSLNAEVER